MQMDLRQAADLPGPGEYENYDRDHRPVHISGLTGKFSETVRMGRDLTMAELAKVFYTRVFTYKYMTRTRTRSHTRMHS
jgi:hypothetical protein